MTLSYCIQSTMFMWVLLCPPLLSFPLLKFPFLFPISFSSTPRLIFDFCESVGFIRVTHRSGSSFHWSVEISPLATILKKMSLPPPTNIGYSQTTADLIIASSLCDVMTAPSTCGFNAGNRSCCELKGGHGVPFLLVFTSPPSPSTVFLEPWVEGVWL